LMQPQRSLLEHVSTYICISLYGLFIILFPIVWILHKTCLPKRKRKSIFITIYLLCIQVCMCARLLYFILLLLVFNRFDRHMRWLQRLYPDLVTLLFLFTNLILCMYWFSIYYYIRKRYYYYYYYYYEVPDGYLKLGIADTKQWWKFHILLFVAFFVIICFPLAIWITCHILIDFYGNKWIFDSSYLYKWVVVCGLFPSLNFALALLYSIAVMRLYTDTVLVSAKVHENHKKWKRIGILSSVCLIVLFFQSIIHMFVNVPMIRSMFGSAVPLLDMFYFILTEFVPNVLIVFILFQFHSQISEPLTILSHNDSNNAQDNNCHQSERDNLLLGDPAFQAFMNEGLGSYQQRHQKHRKLIFDAAMEPTTGEDDLDMDEQLLVPPLSYNDSK